MKAYVFPGQGAQYIGMGKDLYESSSLARELFTQANEILGFNITELMFEGTDDDLKQTKVTQPAIFLHSVILALVAGTPCIALSYWGHKTVGVMNSVNMSEFTKDFRNLKVVDLVTLLKSIEDNYASIVQNLKREVSIVHKKAVNTPATIRAFI